MVQLFEVKALQEGNVHRGFCCPGRLKSKSVWASLCILDQVEVRSWGQWCHTYTAVVGINSAFKGEIHFGLSLLWSHALRVHWLLKCFRSASGLPLLVQLHMKVVWLVPRHLRDRGESFQKWWRCLWNSGGAARLCILDSTVPQQQGLVCSCSSRSSAALSVNINLFVVFSWNQLSRRYLAALCKKVMLIQDKFHHGKQAFWKRDTKLCTVAPRFLLRPKSHPKCFQKVFMYLLQP